MRRAVVFALLLPLNAAWGSSPLGEWARGDGNARVVIAPCGSAICAVNEWIRPGTPHEKAGDRLVLNVAAAAPDRLRGLAYDPQRNRTYNVTMTVGARSMSIEGCVLLGLICRTMEWTRVGP